MAFFSTHGKLDKMLGPQGKRPGKRHEYGKNML